MWVAGSPPAPSVMKQFTNELGITVQTAYGLTETFGPLSTYQEDPTWRSEGKEGISEIDLMNKCVIQCPDMTVEDIQVLDPDSLHPVPHDSTTLGEVMIRGNIVMKGYLGNESATLEAFRG
eukprot:gene3206-4141_t